MSYIILIFQTLYGPYGPYPPTLLVRVQGVWELLNSLSCLYFSPGPPNIVPLSGDANSTLSPYPLSLILYPMQLNQDSEKINLHNSFYVHLVYVTQHSAITHNFTWNPSTYPSSFIPYPFSPIPCPLCELSGTWSTRSNDQIYNRHMHNANSHELNTYDSSWFCGYAYIGN